MEWASVGMWPGCDPLRVVGDSCECRGRHLYPSEERSAAGRALCTLGLRLKLALQILALLLSGLGQWKNYPGDRSHRPHPPRIGNRLGTCELSARECHPGPHPFTCTPMPHTTDSFGMTEELLPGAPCCGCAPLPVRIYGRTLGKQCWGREAVLEACLTGLGEGTQEEPANLPIPRLPAFKMLAESL